jgi:hypothetical protein
MRTRYPTIVLAATAGALFALATYGHGRPVAKPAAGEMEYSLPGKPTLRVPADYRKTFQYLGTWSVANDHGQGAKQLHAVYASPGAISAYRKLGHFPDRTVLVKEVWEATTAPMTTGTVSHSGKLKGWFVMIRDHAGQHPGNKLWGDGWGWAWFDADAPTHTTSTDYKTDCRGCHVPAQASDWVYVGGYPPLKP